MKIEIGSKPLKELTADDLRQIVLIEKCCASLEFWNEPEITRFRNDIFRDTLVIDYVSYRKEDNLKSEKIIFFFNFIDFRFHYHRESERENPRSNGQRVRLGTLRYLIKNGYDVPIYEKA